MLNRSLGLDVERRRDGMVLGSLTRNSATRIQVDKQLLLDVLETDGADIGGEGHLFEGEAIRAKAKAHPSGAVEP